MDTFLSTIYVAIFKQWIQNQNKKYRLHSEENKIILEKDTCYSYITFHSYNIIELYVQDKMKKEVQFYLHFQMKNLHHAISLFHEMEETMDKIVTTPKIRVLLSCSGGMTTGFFAEQLQKVIALLNTSIKVSTVGYEHIYQVADQYDMILLAPQISYHYAQVKSVLKNKIVEKIPSRIFATYDVESMISFILELANEIHMPITKRKEYISPIKTKPIASSILCLSIYQNSLHTYIQYRIYDSTLHIVLDKEIVKTIISMNDIYNLIDTVLLLHKDISIIALALPGIVNEGNVFSTCIIDMDEAVQKHLESRYHKKVILSNDVNTAAIGYYASQEKYQSFAFLFQPINANAGVGSIVNGKLITGTKHFAGEVKYIPLDFSKDRLDLSLTPEGTLELVTKIGITIASMNSPEAIIVYSDLLNDVEEVQKEIENVLLEHINDYTMDIIKISNLQEYILLGLTTLCVNN